jgi:hypothetical protein
LQPQSERYPRGTRQLFESSGLFIPAIRDTSIAAHEVGEVDDPFGNNPTPTWGHKGQVGACQNNLEVGDPLTATNIPPVTGANGFTYHLQELAFFLVVLRSAFDRGERLVF